jgi:acyl carrier protein
LQQLTTAAPLALPERGAVAIRVSVAAAAADGARALHVHARSPAADSGEWQLCARAVLGTAGAGDEPVADDLDVQPPPGAVAIEAHMPPVIAAHRSGDELFAELALPEPLQPSAAQYLLHPLLLEGALQLLSAVNGPGATWQIYECQAIHVRVPGCARLHMRASLADPAQARVQLADASGEPIASLIALPSLAPAAALPAPDAGRLHQLSWVSVPAAHSGEGLEWFAVGERSRALPAPTKHTPEPSYSEITRLLGFASSLADPILVLVWEAGAPDAGAARAAVERLRQIVDSCAEHEVFASTRVVVLTRHAQRVGPDDAELDPVHAALWGAVRTLQLEQPGRFGVLDWDDEPESAPALLAALGSRQDQLAVRGSHVFAPRLVAARASEVAVAPAIAAEHTVLITGATGALGTGLARHLVEKHGVRRLLLCGTGPFDETEALTALGASVRFVACDLRDRGELQALLGSIPAHAPLSAVFHADAEACAEGAQHLHELVNDHPLTTFVVFTSLAGLLGSPGGWQRAAAECFVEALVHARRHRGLAGQVVQCDMLADAPFQHQLALRPLSLEQHLRLFDAARAQAAPQLTAAEFDGALRELTADRLPAPLAAMGRRQVQRGALGTLRAGGLKARLRRTNASDRPRVLRAGLLEVCAQVLGTPAEQLEPQRAFAELGMDSVRGLELRNRLADVAHLALPPTLLFDYPTPDELARYFEVRLLSRASVEVEGRTAHAAAPLVAMCRKAHAADGGSEQTRSAVWQLIDASLRWRLLQPGGAARSGLASKAYAISRKPGTCERLICLPALMPPMAPGQYQRLSAAVEGRHDVVVLSYPGYHSDEALPVDRTSLIACLADGASANAGDGEFALCGWSSGGWVAHAVAAELERRGGRAPHAVVLFDTLTFTPEQLRVDPVTHRSHMRDQSPTPGSDWIHQTCDEELTAWAHYFELFAGWTPERLSCPVLQLMAAEDFEAGGFRISSREQALSFADEYVEAAGNHLTMLLELAPNTAALMHAWLEARREPAAADAAVTDEVGGP